MTPVFNPHENPRVEGMDDKSGAGLILVRCPYQTISKNGERTYGTSPLAIIIQDDLVTTVSPRKLTIHNRCLQASTGTADPIVYSLMVVNLVFDQFLNDTDQLAAQTQSMEVRVGKASHNTLLYEIMAVEKKVSYFSPLQSRTLRAFGPSCKNQPISRLTRRIGVSWQSLSAPLTRRKRWQRPTQRS